MTKAVFDSKIKALRANNSAQDTLLIDEKTAYEVFGKGNFKNLYTYGGWRVMISTHLPDHTILPVGG